MKRHRAEREGISSFPAPILQHILSFLSQKKAVRTCVLSKSWRHLWSTRPVFSLKESYFGEDKEKFRKVLEKSLQVYSDQKLCIEDFNVWPSMVDPELVSLLEKWIPLVVQDLGVKKFNLSFISRESAYFDLPSSVFESDSLQELYLERCNLSQINSVGNNHLKTLMLEDVYIEEENFAKIIMSSCPLIEDLTLRDCKGFRTVKMHNHHNLKSFELDDGRSIEIYLPSCVGRISITRCPNWFRHRNYFPRLTRLYLCRVPLSNEWFDSFSRNFPCLELLHLLYCNGFDEFQLSSRSIEYLEFVTGNSPKIKKATIDTPSLKWFNYATYLSQSISFTTTSSEWNSQINLYSLDLDDSLWFLKLSELVAAFSRSEIDSLMLSCDSGSGNLEHIEHLFDISVCCGDSYKPVAMKGLDFNFDGLYYDSFFSDLMNGLFCIIRPREINQFWYAEKDRQRMKSKNFEFLCKALQMGRWEKDEGMLRSFWQQDLEEVSLQVKTGSEEWHPVQQGTTISWSEYVAASLLSEFRLRLKWRE